MTRALAEAALCALAVALTLACAVGVLVMRDVWQKLHFVAPPATLGAAAVALALGLAGGWQAALKPLLVVLLLGALNAVVTHALARAAWVRAHDGWPPRPEDATPAGPEDAAPPGGRP